MSVEGGSEDEGRNEKSEEPTRMITEGLHPSKHRLLPIVAARRRE